MSQFKNYFHFNRGERRGLVVLLAILVLVIFANIFMHQLVPDKIYDFSEFEKKIAAFEAQQDLIKDSLARSHKLNKIFKANDNNLHPFPFDPNNLPIDQWLAMGLSKKQAIVIKNFEKKGGKFKTPDDLARIYSISDKEFQTLRPFIRIENKETLKNIPDITSNDDKLPAPVVHLDSIAPKPVKDVGVREFQTVDINLADTLDLQQLKGIGPSFARRIIKYRELLGGYARKEQLLEVYGMDTLRYAGFIEKTRIDSTTIRQINLNKAGIKELIRHPYIEYFLAKTIVLEREKTGPFQSIEELKNQIPIPDELFEKIRPYLSL